MSTQTRRRYTLEEYFALELAAEEKYEYFAGEVYNMSGGSRDHEQIIANLIRHLGNKLSGRLCRVYPSNLRVKVPSMPPYRYTDLTALCAEPQFEQIGGVDALLNPSLIVEVLSASTEVYDRTEKFTHYKSIASFSEYVLIAQHRAHATHFIRGEQGVWTHREYNDLDEVMRLASMDCELGLREVYENVEFPPPAPAPFARPDTT